MVNTVWIVKMSKNCQKLSIIDTFDSKLHKHGVDKPVPYPTAGKIQQRIDLMAFIADLTNDNKNRSGWTRI